MPSSYGENPALAVTDTDFHQLDQFVAYAEQRFELPLLAGCFGDSRQEPDIPARAVGLSLILGEVVHIPSFLQLEAETTLPQWQRWVGYLNPISDDTFGYAAERMNSEKLRRAGMPHRLDLPTPAADGRVAL